jgi:hypothetical protein
MTPCERTDNQRKDGECFDDDDIHDLPAAQKLGGVIDVGQLTVRIRFFSAMVCTSDWPPRGNDPFGIERQLCL